MVKGAKGIKIKVLFQGLHVTHDIPTLICSFNFSIFHTQFTIVY
jgi:hypothetical protein